MVSPVIWGELTKKRCSLAPQSAGLHRFRSDSGSILYLEMNPTTLVEALQWISGEVRSTRQIRGCWKWLATPKEPIEQTHRIRDIQLPVVVRIGGIFTERGNSIEEVLEAMNRVTDVDCSISV